MLRVLKDNVKYALIQYNKVAYIFDSREIKEINDDSLEIVEIPQELLDEVAIGTACVNGEIHKKQLIEYKQEQIEQVNKDFEKLVKIIRGQYVPEAEAYTFELQNTQAHKYLHTKNPLDVPFLATLAKEREMDIEALAQKIVAKNSAFNLKYAIALSHKQKIVDKVLDSKDIAEVKGIKFDIQDIAALENLALKAEEVQNKNL